jgi:eukaryotic-like serine/threonine-protein kinase
MSTPAEQLKQLGRYDLTRVLGKGAMGIVYEGLDPRLNRKVAIKTILKGHMDDEDAAKEYSMRFMREAQSVARLNHAHIVQVYDFGEQADIAYIVMEFIKGKELKNFFDANERFELKEAVRIMCELLDALEMAHENGIVHRDIKPANVMLDGQARVKLADFGVARVTDDRSAAEKTQAGTMVGTPAYMSPEQITGGNVDRRTDIFSAGIILYQFLTGEKPFTGSGAWTIAKKIIQDHPPLPSSINNTISPLFDNVVNKALSKQVETRYQTAKEFANALRRALEGRSEEDDSDKTVVGSMAEMGAMPKLTPQAASARPEATKGTTSATGSQEVELEFWRAIKDGNDPDDFELYVQQFPNGIYAALAKRKIAKLRGVAPEETSTKAKEQEKKEAEDAAKREAEVKQKLAEEKAKLEAQLAEKEAEYKKREAEAEAKRAAETKARAEADAKREAEMAKREAEMQARRANEEKERLEAIERAKKEAAAQLAAKEAEYQKREAEARAQAEAEAKARKETEARARQEAEALAAKARAEAEARAKKQAEEFAKSKAEAEARAKKDAEERAKQQAEAVKAQAEAAKREAELKKKLAEAPKAKMPIGIVAGVIVAIAALGGGAWYYFNKASLEKQAALTAALETATKAAEELKAAQSKQLDALKALEQAREAEAKARAAGDAVALKKAQEASQRAEAEANKLGEAVKQREAAAQKARDEMKKAQDAAKQAKAEPKKETVAAVAPKPEPKAEPAPPKPEPKAEAAPKAAPKAEAKAESKGEAPKKLSSRAERERLADEEAARKALAAAGKAPAQQTVVASAAPTAVPGASAPAPGAAPAKPAATEFETLFQQAQKMEGDGNAKDAIRVYRRAARAGSGKAAKRLGEIFDKGAPGVSRDYAESLQWYETARQLGETIETAGKR